MQDLVSPEPSRGTWEMLSKYGRMTFELIYSLVSALVPVDVGGMEMESNRSSALTCSQFCPVSQNLMVREQ